MTWLARGKPTMPSKPVDLQFEYHHMGIPTTVVRANERYSSNFKMYTSGSEGSQFRIQWHRFEADSPLHAMIRSLPHVAFKVTDTEQAIAGKNVLLGPYCPFEGFKVAMVEDGGVPIEFITPGSCRSAFIVQRLVRVKLRLRLRQGPDLLLGQVCLNREVRSQKYESVRDGSKCEPQTSDNWRLKTD